MSVCKADRLVFHFIGLAITILQGLDPGHTSEGYHIQHKTHVRQNTTKETLKEHYFVSHSTLVLGFYMICLECMSF